MATLRATAVSLLFKIQGMDADYSSPAVKYALSHFGEATNEKYPYYRSATLFRLWKPADDPNFEEAIRGLLATFCIAGIIAAFSANAAAEHPGWFVRVCPAKTEANRVHLTFSGGRQGFTWSWIRGRTLDELDLPRRFHSVARVFIRAVAASTPSNLQPHAYVCVGFRDHIVQRMEFDDHENHQKNWNDTDDCAC